MENQKDVIVILFPHPKGTRVINDEGEDVLQKYEIGDLREGFK